jgi:hypothetical protein
MPKPFYDLLRDIPWILPAAMTQFLNKTPQSSGSTSIPFN